MTLKSLGLPFEDFRSRFVMENEAGEQVWIYVETAALDDTRANTTLSREGAFDLMRPRIEQLAISKWNRGKLTNGAVHISARELNPDLYMTLP